MGRNKKLRARIEGLRSVIAVHLRKIAREQNRPSPDDTLLRHWKTEIAAWQRTVRNLERRLVKGKRHED
ncbi:MAG: hypothetical protein A2V62_03045 [Nitrospirae bacterium RBG_19FT_COMBO_58_9]|nr:MAG: hypothetical protein A2V62_03045 [Nitrospirae bacterium RBG_19FT_COMBO_58_9]